MKDERVEVLDLESDVLVYHPETHELLLSPLLQKKEVFETFPVFSPDGRKLYFCAAEAKPIPAEYKEIRYSLCSIDFNPEDGTFGEKIDTLVNAAAMKKSISFPRPSYDGEYIMFTLSDYGNFSIWHKEADLWLLDLQDGGMRPIKEVNSDDTESFHNWSSNSRWFVFSSRREMGFIPVCIWQVWMRMGWWASLSCFLRKILGSITTVWSTRTMFPILQANR